MNLSAIMAATLRCSELAAVGCHEGWSEGSPEHEQGWLATKLAFLSRLVAGARGLLAGAARADLLHRLPDYLNHGALDAGEVGEMARGGHLAGEPLHLTLVVVGGHVGLLLE